MSHMSSMAADMILLCVRMRSGRMAIA